MEVAGFLLSSESWASSSSCCSRRTSRSLSRASRDISRLSRSFSILRRFCSSFRAAISSARRFCSSSRACASARWFSALLARRLDRLALAIFWRLSSSFSLCNALRLRDSSCFSKIGKRCSSMVPLRTFSFSSRLFLIVARKPRTSSRFVAMHSHFAPSRPSSAGWDASSVPACGFSSVPSVACAVDSETRRLLAALAAALAFLLFFLGFH